MLGVQVPQTHKFMLGMQVQEGPMGPSVVQSIFINGILPSISRTLKCSSKNFPNNVPRDLRLDQSTKHMKLLHKFLLSKRFRTFTHPLII